MRIVFLGTGEIGVPSLRALASAHDILAVVSQPDRPAGRDMKLRPSPIKRVAEELGLPVLQPQKLRAPEAAEQLRALSADIFIVVAYGQILSRAVLDIPPFGCLNVHASLLPRHRGASPIQAAILAGDAETGVTIMRMDEGLDTGDILLKEGFFIGRHETGGELHDRLAAQAPGLLARVLEQLQSGALSRHAQDSSLTTYAPKLTKDDARIDWSLPAVELDRRIRAFTPWPGSFTTIPASPQPTLLKVHRAEPVGDGSSGQPGQVLTADGSGIIVQAGDGAILLHEVQAAGGKRLSASAFINGRSLAAGVILGQKSV